MKGADLMKNKSVRIAGIILAVILGMAALFYLGGLVNQLTLGYQQWLSDGGMTGKATMGTIYFSPLACWRSAMSLSGLKCTFFVSVLLGGLYLIIRLYNRFGSNDYDPRNFTRSKRGTYGTSGWMSEKEMREVLEIASPERAKGIILGKTERGSVICLPEDTRLNKHIAVFGASGTRKSRGVIRPALFQSIRRGESVVVADPKSEMFADTAELFKKHGYKVRVYNLLRPEYSDSWNCMFDLDGDTLMAQILTDVIISNTKGDEKGDHFWDNGESNLLKSLILYVDLDTTRTPEERNLAAVYQMLTQHTEKELTMLFDRLPLDHPAKAPYSLFSQASDSVRAGIVLGLGTRLQVLQSEAVRQITRHSDIDLSEPGWNKCAYFIILDDQNSSLEFLSALFFAFMFIKLVRYADSTPEQRCKIPVNIILDEMNNIGTIKDFGRRLSTICEVSAMGRASTRENKNIYQTTREAMHLTREAAGELLESIPPERIEKIENERSLPHPDEVLTMAEKYKQPGLCNYYCANQCPIGQEYVPEVKIKDLSQIVLEMLASLNSMNRRKDRLIEITADGVISDDELEDFIRIREELERISIAVETLQLWSERMLATGAIDAERYEEYERRRAERD